MQLSVDDAYIRAIGMYYDDLEPLALDPAIPEEELELNRARMEMIPCRGDVAIALHQTFMEYAEVLRRAEDISDTATLHAWATTYHSWRDDNWPAFLEAPCGELIPQIAFFDSFAYNLALAQLTPYGETILDSLDELEAAFEYAHAAELAFLESLERRDKEL